MIVIVGKKEREILEGLRLLRDMEGVNGGLPGEIVKLKKQLVELEIQKGKKEEENAKERRELTHMIGLEKKRQEFEIEQAKKETALKVREENLAAERKQFAEHLEFNTERFEKVEAYLKDMMAEVLARLPNVNMEIVQKRRTT